MSASWITAVGPWHWLLIAIVRYTKNMFGRQMRSERREAVGSVKTVDKARIAEDGIEAPAALVGGHGQ